MRKIAFRVLPLLVALWTTLAILGGVDHLAGKGESSYDSAAEIGVGLCTVTVAILLSTGVIRKVQRPGLTTKLAWRPEVFRVIGPVAHEDPPSVAPSPRFLQVFRT